MHLFMPPVKSGRCILKECYIGYKPVSKPTLKTYLFHAEPGEKPIANSWPDGQAGKSTLLLINHFGFYD